MKNDIELFVAGCALCEEAVNKIELGKCAGCRMTVHDIRKKDKTTARLAKRYNITAVPTIVINSRIKIVGVPDFPMVCSPDFYAFLERNYPLKA